MAEVAEQDRLTLCLPFALVKRIEEFQRRKQTGQILINFNSGDAQSYEIKEHYRTPAVR